MARAKTIWKNRQGNICFRFEYHGKWWIIPCVAVMLSVVVCAVEYFIFNTFLAIIPSILICLLATYVCAHRSERKADIAMLSFLRKKLNTLVHEELEKRKDVHETNRKLFTKCKGTYGEIEYRSVLVLLSDETLLEYPIRWHHGDESYYELETNALICTDCERIDYIRPRTVRDRIEGSKISDDNKLRIVLFGLLLVSLSILIGMGWLIYSFGIKALVYFLCYIFAFVALDVLQNKIKYRVLSAIIKTLFIPIVVVGYLIKMAQPMMTIFVSFVGVPFFIWAISTLVLKAAGQFGAALSVNTILFISLTLTAIICVHSQSFTRWMIKHSPIKDKGNHRYEKFTEDLALYMIDPKNYNFVFSLLYVIFLSCSAFCNIEYGSDFINKEVDLVIMKSFLVFLAFNTMKQKSRETEVNTKDLLVKVLGLFEHDEN